MADNSSFQGSKGWFERFKKRFSLHNVKIVTESGTVDDVAASQYPTKLKEFIASEEYKYLMLTRQILFFGKECLLAPSYRKGKNLHWGLRQLRTD